MRSQQEKNNNDYHKIHSQLDAGKMYLKSAIC